MTGASVNCIAVQRSLTGCVRALTAFATQSVEDFFLATFILCQTCDVLWNTNITKTCFSTARNLVLLFLLEEEREKYKKKEESHLYFQLLGRQRQAQLVRGYPRQS
jgi:hypothetical protein